MKKKAPKNTNKKNQKRPPPTNKKNNTQKTAKDQKGLNY
jgi:hypothetical protein